MKFVLMLSLCLVVGTAHAGDTYRFDRGVVSVGDSTGALIQRAGQPSRTVPIENKSGAVVGERWEYYLRDKTVIITIVNGKITQIEDGR